MHKAVRLWPLISVTAMVLLGLAVGRRSTALDDWFQSHGHSPARWLQVLMDPRVIAVVLVACVAIAVSRRRWRLAAATVLAPIVGVALVGLLKPLFDRDMGGGLAYPSGHTTFAVIVLGMAVLVAGVAWWAVLVAIVYCLLGMVGLGVSIHYFTDTVGGLFLGTAIVCVAALTSGQTPHRT
jgi:membrane-associated phospholipid phosphatase